MMSPARWEKLKSQAQAAVDRTLSELPPELLAPARQVPILFETESESDPDLLGIYANFIPGEVGEFNGPIILYLVAIAEFCADENTDFAEEVRLTYLHEIGHHLGWEEDDVEERGLG